MHVTTAGELRYPWLPPIADLCTQRQPALAYVVSVSSRVMREIWSGSLFFSLVPVFSTNSRGTACYAG